MKRRPAAKFDVGEELEATRACKKHPAGTRLLVTEVHNTTAGPWYSVLVGVSFDQIMHTDAQGVADFLGQDDMRRRLG